MPPQSHRKPFPTQQGICLLTRLTLTYQTNSLGFEDVVTIDMLREAYPVLDVIDHNRRPKDRVSTINIKVHFMF